MTVDQPNGLAALPRRYGAGLDCAAASGAAAGGRSWPEAGSACDVADASRTRTAQSHAHAERCARRRAPRSAGRTPLSRAETPSLRFWMSCDLFELDAAFTRGGMVLATLMP